MNDYDFSILNDKEFENLTIDLISRDRGKRFERFKAGRDGGIDGRYYGEDGRQEIIQCKHYLKTGYSGLISSLKKKSQSNGKNEADKVKLLDPEKYIFVTSLPLSPSNKKEIKEIFEPYIKNDSDIYGQEDLNDLLRANSDIEENHYKLWISSTTVLQRIFNNAIKGRSESKLEEIHDKIKYYVKTQNHDRAIEKLESSHTIILTGEWGIGKTTLAEQIALFYIAKGFEFCVIAKDISDAEAIFEKDKKQIFYFDDFLGSNFLSALEPHTDSQIMQFIARIKRDKNKRFILTSRVNIIKPSINRSNAFKNKNLDSDEFILKVDELKEIDKARILYNHIWYSDLDEEYIDEIYKEKRYKKIINDKAFNPRLIDIFTKNIMVKSIPYKNYWKYIQDSLDNSEEVWSQPFDIESDDFMRGIILLVVFNGNTIEENRFNRAFNNLKKIMNWQNTSHINREFDIVIKDVLNSFIKKSIFDTNVEYALCNPSIADFIIHRYKNNSILIQIMNSLKTIDSLKVIEDLYHNEFIEQKFYYEILESIEYNKNDNINYLVKLAELFYEESEDSTDNNVYVDYLENIVDIVLSKEENILLKSVYDFIKLLDHLIYEKRLKITPKVVEKIINTINEDSYDLISEFREVMNFFESNDIALNEEKYQKTLTKLSKKIEKYFLEDYDSPSFVSDETISKIEALIYQDIKEQTESYLDDFFRKTYISPTYNESILKLFNRKIVGEKFKKNIIENCEDRLIYELFVEEEKEKIVKTPVLEKKVEITSDDEVDDIDNLFERE